MLFISQTVASCTTVNTIRPDDQNINRLVQYKFRETLLRNDLISKTQSNLKVTLLGDVSSPSPFPVRYMAASMAAKSSQQSSIWTNPSVTLGKRSARRFTWLMKNKELKKCKWFHQCIVLSLCTTVVTEMNSTYLMSADNAVLHR
jgi:hypothetical protein